MNRRQWLQSGGALAGAGLLAPVRAVAAEVKPVRIKEIEVFTIEIPTPPAEVKAGAMNRTGVVRVSTESGVRGYSFGSAGGAGIAGLSSAAGAGRAAFEKIRQTLVGSDLFAIEQHLKRGLIDWAGIEEAMWDAIGKVAGQPVWRLLGGARASIPAYITCVWPGPADQSQTPIKDQASYAAKLKDAGFLGLKVRAWRPHPLDDADACAAMKAAAGPNFHIMFDRTANAPGTVWDYPTGLAVAKALKENGADWLEEPFARDDFESPARLAREMEDFMITGGEGFRGIDAFRECLVHASYDMLQPDLRHAGGLFMVRKIAALCDAFHKPVAMHGAMGLGLAGRVQASAAYGAPWEEVALVVPPLLPQEQWAPALKILRSKELFEFRNGEIVAPTGPGLGLDLDEQAIDRYRV
jgi:D-galactarolactone cycloisomerase